MCANFAGTEKKRGLESGPEEESAPPAKKARRSEEAAEPSPTTTTTTTSCGVEWSRYRAGHYSLLDDEKASRARRRGFRLAAQLCFLSADDETQWDAEWGGYTSFVAAGEEEEVRRRHFYAILFRDRGSDRRTFSRDDC